MNAPGPDELQIRDLLIRRGVGPDAAVMDPPPMPAAPPLPTAPPMPAAPPTVHELATDDEPDVPAPRKRALNDRLPAWFEKDRPHLTAEEPPADDEDDDPAPVEEEELDEDEDGEDEEQPGEEDTTRDLFKRLFGSNKEAHERAAALEARAQERARKEKAEQADEDEDQEDEEDAGEEDEEEDGDDAPAAGEKGKKAPTPRPARRRPPFAAPAVPTVSKASVLQRVQNIKPHTRWAAYNGTALAAGFWREFPQFFTDATAYMVETQDSATTAYCLSSYTIAVAIFVLDRAARGWWLPFAWLARIPSASLVVGVLLYGNPAS